MSVPAQNIEIVVVMATLLAVGTGVVSYRPGRGAGIMAAGWALGALAFLAYLAFHPYVADPLATMLTLAVAAAFGLILIRVARRLFPGPAAG